MIHGTASYLHTISAVFVPPTRHCPPVRYKLLTQLDLQVDASKADVQPKEIPANAPMRQTHAASLNKVEYAIHKHFLEHKNAVTMEIEADIHVPTAQAASPAYAAQC